MPSKRGLAFFNGYPYINLGRRRGRSIAQPGQGRKPAAVSNFFGSCPSSTALFTRTPAMKKTISLLTACLILNGCISSTQGLEGTDWVKVAEKTLNSGLYGEAASSALSNSDIIAGLKQALSIGSQNVVGQLGAANGFNLDPNIRIPLPDQLQRVDRALSAVGMNRLTEDLELRLNRAAEAATPKAKQYFLSAIQNMTINDAKGILTGPQDSATQYLHRTMGTQLAGDIKPIVETTLADAGAVRAYDQVLGQYSQIPFMPDVKADLNNYVVEKALDGIFYYVAAEEAAIRQNPAARTTELLKKVFANR